MMTIAQKSKPSPSRSNGHAVRTWLWGIVLLPGAVWLVVRLFGLERGPLVQFIAYTPYVAAWTLVPAIALLAFRRWTLGAVASVVATALTLLVLPRWVHTAAAVPAAGTPLRVLTSNLEFGQADVHRIVDLVREHRVDVLSLQEYTPEAEAALATAGLTKDLPFRQTLPMPGAAGSALYSKYPLVGGGSRVYDDVWFHQVYATVEVPDGRPVRVESVHPCAPSNPRDLRCWWRGLQEQPGVTQETLQILAGDFNATLDHAALRTLLDRGYHDAAAQVGAGFVGTWGPYGGGAKLPPVTIDHVLVDRRIGVRSVQVYRVPHTDHRAVLADLVLPR